MCLPPKIVPSFCFSLPYASSRNAPLQEVLLGAALRDDTKNSCGPKRNPRQCLCKMLGSKRGGIIIRDEQMTNDFRPCDVIPEACFFQMSTSPCAYVCVIDVKTKGKFPWDHLVTLLFLSKKKSKACWEMCLRNKCAKTMRRDYQISRQNVHPLFSSRATWRSLQARWDLLYFPPFIVCW